MADVTEKNGIQFIETTIRCYVVVLYHPFLGLWCHFGRPDFAGGGELGCTASVL